MVINKTHEQRLFDSCRILFGPEVDIGWDFLFYIQLSGLKSAFRKRALLTHPDRTAYRQREGSPAKADSFIITRDAYDHLLDFVRKRHTFRPGKKRPPQTRHRTKSAHRNGASGKAGKSTSPGFFYSGALPRRRLLMGEFLYYSGVISWESLIKAVVWQRRQRPQLGRIAAEKGWVLPGQVRFAALRKKAGTPIGETLIRHGLLERWQVDVLLWRQRRMQTALGELFIRAGLISQGRLNHLLKKFDLHNEAYPAHS
jgi:hypothetical protein